MGAKNKNNIIKNQLTGVFFFFILTYVGGVSELGQTVEIIKASLTK